MPNSLRPVRHRISDRLEVELVPGDADQEELIVRPKRARRLLGGIAESTLWKWVRNGEFDVVRVGHLTFITLVSLRAFIARHTVEGQAQTPAQPPDRGTATDSTVEVD